MVGVRLDVMLFKFTMSEDRQAVLRGHKGLARTKLGLEENLTPAQQERKLEMWPLFKEAKVTNKRAIELFVDDIQICSPSSI
jgi:hypothetical protein